MARKVVNRKVLREQADAAEAAAGAEAKEGKTKEKAAKKPTKRKTKKEPAEVRLKLFWGVYNQSMKLVAKYDFAHKKAADQKAGELSASGKSPHFVQKIKETIQE